MIMRWSWDRVCLNLNFRLLQVVNLTTSFLTATTQRMLLTSSQILMNLLESMVCQAIDSDMEIIKASPITTIITPSILNNFIQMQIKLTDMMRLWVASTAAWRKITIIITWGEETSLTLDQPVPKVLTKGDLSCLLRCLALETIHWEEFHQCL